MRFTDPIYALLFLPLVVGLAWSWRHVHGLAKVRKRISFAIRAVLASCLVLALMGPQLRQPNRGLAVMFLIDRSDSISEADRKRSLEFVAEAISKLGPDDAAGIVAFGRDPVFESVSGGRRPFGRIESTTEGSASNLAAALRLASAGFPEGKSRRIVILSDGNETVGDALAAADVAATDDITIDTVALGSQEGRSEVTVLDLIAPTERRADEPFEIRAIVESSVAQTGLLILDRDGVVVSRQTVSLSPGKNSIVLSQRLTQPGFYRYRATLEVNGDADTRNNIGSAYVAVKGKPRILLAQGDTSKRELANALVEQGLVVDLVGPGGLPARAGEYQPYDAIFLNDLNAAMTTTSQMELIRQTVRDTGVGFGMIGGEDSFLPGGWYGTPVAEILPVDLNIRQRKSFPSTSVLIVVDTSGSMGMLEDGVTKLQLAAQAAVQTANLLSPIDRLGAAGSTDGIELVAPIQELRDKNSVISQIKRLRTGGGGIYVEPSMKFAEKNLMAEETKVRHFILLADGADADSHGMSVGIAARMRSNKITTSVVAIGDGKDVPFLKTLAAAGGGRFYLADKASKLPAIFTQDVAVMSRSAIEEGVFVPKVQAGEEVLRGISIESIPALYAYCLTDSRPLARTGMRTAKDDPLLASWQFGLGNSLAFTSDAQARWALPWVRWDAFGQFWAQAVRSVTRRATQNSYDVEVRPEGGRGEIELSATDKLGNPLTAENLKVLVSKPNGESSEVSLMQVGPGLYKGNFPAQDLGSYIVTVAEPGPNGSSLVNSTGFSIPYPQEYRQYRTNDALLNQMQEATGGNRLSEPAASLRPTPNVGQSIADLWHVFVLAAALLLPLDVACRRIALPFGAIVAKVLSFFASRPAPVESDTRIDRLQRAKAKMQSPGQAAPKEQIVIAEAEKSAARPVAKPSPTTTANRLLEAKRQRQESQGSTEDDS